MDYDTVPKVEKEIPSTLEISEHLLPIIKNWEVGNRYLIKLEVENVSINKGSMYDPNSPNAVRSSFKVLGAEAVQDRNDDGQEEMSEKVDGKKAFIRAVVKASRKYLED